MRKNIRQFLAEAQSIALTDAERAMARVAFVERTGIQPLSEDMHRSALHLGLGTEEKQAFRTELREHMHRHPPGRGAFDLLFAQLLHVRRAFAPVFLLVFIASVTGSGVAYASSAAIPGDILYSVKVDVLEELQGRLLRTEAARQAWRIERLERRLIEAEQLAKRGNDNDVAWQNLRTRIDHHMALFVDLPQEDIVDVPPDTEQATVMMAKTAMAPQDLKQEDREKIRKIFEEHGEKLSAFEKKGKLPRGAMEIVRLVREQWRPDRENVLPDVPVHTISSAPILPNIAASQENEAAALSATPLAKDAPQELPTAEVPLPAGIDLPVPPRIRKSVPKDDVTKNAEGKRQRHSPFMPAPKNDANENVLRIEPPHAPKILDGEEDSTLENEQEKLRKKRKLFP